MHEKYSYERESVRLHLNAWESSVYVSYLIQFLVKDTAFEYII